MYSVNNFISRTECGSRMLLRVNFIGPINCSEARMSALGPDIVEELNRNPVLPSKKSNFFGVLSRCRSDDRLHFQTSANM